MQGNPRKQTLLGVVAESLAVRSERKQTVIDVVHGRALQHYGESLRQYVTIALGDVELGRRAMDQVRAVAAARGAQEMAQHPGIRARLFHIAREVVLGVASTSQNASSPKFIPWKRTLVSPDRDAAISDLRTGLARDHAEVLELRYARELSLEEVAFVRGESLETATAAITKAENEARFILGTGTQNADSFARAILDAYSIQRIATATEAADTGEQEATPSLAPGSIIGERYRIEKCIGSGSFADVFRASDTSVTGHMVAIKLLHQPARTDDARAAAIRELHLIASVFHPSIVQFKDHGWHESRLWFVMPWYEGESLETRIRREALTRAEARRIFEPLARALATMHASGLRHQDVKPDNIFLARIKHFDEGGSDEILPVLLDLGVAAKDAEMVVAGTPTYFAPEVAAQFAASPSGHEVTHQADVFALALALRNSLEPETEEDVTGGAIETFIERRTREVPELPRGKDLAFLNPHFERWLAIDPSKRPTAGELATELAVLTSPEEKRARRTATLKWAVPATIGFLLAAGGMIFAVSKQADFERMQAKAARLETAEVRANLDIAEERGKTLETNVEAIRDRYESSTLTNKQLTQKLAETEGDLNATRNDLGKTRKRANDLDESLAATTAKNSELTTSLDATRGDLSSARKQLESSQLAYAAEQAENARLTRDVNEARAESRVALARVNEINRELTEARADLAVTRDERRDLERTVRTLESQKSAVEAELVVAKRRIERLEKQLDEKRVKEAPTGRDVPTAPAVPITR
jgi:serine/threonine protein kinase